jgi:hypothetical protein
VQKYWHQDVEKINTVEKQRTDYALFPIACLVEAEKREGLNLD